MLSMSIDGICTMSPSSTVPIAELFPAFDGIPEIRVSEINNTAEFGGINDITTISKSGTNAYHSGVFENHQNAAFRPQHIQRYRSEVDHNDFGCFISGPVSIPKLYHGKDKTLCNF
jgi:hypothetical protein